MMSGIYIYIMIMHMQGKVDEGINETMWHLAAYHLSNEWLN